MTEQERKDAAQQSGRRGLDDDILLDVQHLTKRFAADRNFFGKATSHVHAVEDVSFFIRRGEAFGLVGTPVRILIRERGEKI